MRTLPNLLLGVASVAVAVGVAEAYLRATGYSPMQDLLDGRQLVVRASPDPLRRYEGTPFGSGVAWRARVDLDSHGFRDDDHPVAKGEGVYRIAVLGDSIAFGNFLAVGETFPARLERLFRSAQERVEVVNMALGGYDTLQEVATLEAVGTAFRPDLVVVAFCFNDVGTDAINLEYIEKAATYGSSRIYALRVAQLVRASLDRFSGRWASREPIGDAEFLAANADHVEDVGDDARLRSRIEVLEDALARGRDYHRFAPLYASPARIGKLRHALGRLRELGRAHGFAVVGLIVPVLDGRPENGDLYRAAYAIVAGEFERQGFGVVSLHPEFSAAGLDGLRRWSDDLLHPDARGHRLIAERLYREVRRLRQGS
jgi:lysophospholipase L1-like esterase